MAPPLVNAEVTRTSMHATPRRENEFSVGIAPSHILGVARHLTDATDSQHLDQFRHNAQFALFQVLQHDR